MYWLINQSLCFSPYTDRCNHGPGVMYQWQTPHGLHHIGRAIYAVCTLYLLLSHPKSFPICTVVVSPFPVDMRDLVGVKLWRYNGPRLLHCHAAVRVTGPWSRLELGRDDQCHGSRCNSSNLWGGNGWKGGVVTRCYLMIPLYHSIGTMSIDTVAPKKFFSQHRRRYNTLVTNGVQFLWGGVHFGSLIWEKC